MLKYFRLQSVALAGYLLLLPLAPLWSAAASAQTAPKSKKQIQEHKRDKRVRGQRDMVDGQIKNVTCKGRALDMTFDDSDEILHFHTDNYFKVEFSAINFTPHGTMNPCKQVKGMYARVYFYDIKGQPREGDLISVELRK